MHEERVARERRFCESFRPAGIQGLGQLGLGFGFVNSGVGGGVHDHVRRDFPAGSRDTFDVPKITAKPEARRTQGEQFAKRREAALEFPADLPGFSEQEDFHTVRPA